MEHCANLLLVFIKPACNKITKILLNNQNSLSTFLNQKKSLSTKSVFNGLKRQHRNKVTSYLSKYQCTYELDIGSMAELGFNFKGGKIYKSNTHVLMNTYTQILDTNLNNDKSFT